MIHSILILLFSGIVMAGFSQENFNLELVVNIELEDGEIGNDVWGFEDQNGIEYAVLGTRDNTKIYSLEDPFNPVLRITVQGSYSVWRDMKSWGNRIYSIAAANTTDGLLIFDMSDAPDNIEYHFSKPPLALTSDSLERAHNLFVDDYGFLYAADINTHAGIVIFDLNENPDEPKYINHFNSETCHDIMVKNDTLFSSNIFAGNFSLFDISDKMNPIQIGLQETTTYYTHNAWVSDDGKYLFTTDEKENAFVDAYDITDPNNIILLDKYQPLATENNDVIPHNTHYYDGYLVTSWNTDGLVILDAKRPHNLVNVGSFDTYLELNGGFAGCWGTYPFLESGLILASDRQTGLYILEPNYSRACWLEGNITECNSGLSINGVNVKIISADLNREKSDPLGFYATGQVTSGTFMVEFSHPEYDTLVMSAVLVNDELTILDIEMCREDLTSIQSIEIGNLILSPNPASNFIQLDSEDGLNYNYTITDVQGKIFLQSSLKDNRIDVSAFANGIYFIKLMNGNEIVGVNKFVVQR